MANASELTVSIAKLEERVTNNIKFFWVVVAFGFVWLSALTTLLIHFNEATGHIETAQAGLENRLIKQNLASYAGLPSNEFK